MVERESEEVARVSGLNPETSSLSSQIEADRHDQLVALGSKMGGAFDRAYVDAQVATHRDTLKLIGNRLLPSATTDEVKRLIERIRPEVAKHYDLAKALQQKRKD